MHIQKEQLRKAAATNPHLDEWERELLSEIKTITRQLFEEKTGSTPIEDDLERCNCKLAGQIGHWNCGWCEKHDTPRFMCGCIFKGHGE